jgi:hypothetical protein
MSKNAICFKSPKLVTRTIIHLCYNHVSLFGQVRDKAFISSHWHAARSAAGDAVIPFLS